MKRNKSIIITALCAVLFLLVSYVIVSLFGGLGEDVTKSSLQISSSQPVAGNTESSEEHVENSVPEISESTEEEIFSEWANTIIENKENLTVKIAEDIDLNFVLRFKELLGRDKVKLLADSLKQGVVLEKDFRKHFGYSEKAFKAIFNNSLERTIIVSQSGNGDMVFVGDVSFDDRYSVMNSYRGRGKGIEGLVSEDVLEILRNADITMANNEFTFTERGEPTPDKKFTFRSKPKNVSIYDEMGIDIVGLANNHAFDYGPDSLTDTLATLDGAGIAHVGAGENLNDAKAPYYFIINGYKVAIIAGTAIDRFSTRGATDSQSGVFQIYDTVSMSRTISSAKEVADIVIAYVHWGNESTTELTSGQKSMGKAFVDAGADLVVGMHSHCMQGIECYKGKMIAYSLGNFTFSGYKLTGAVLKTNISDDGVLTNTFYPVMHKNNYTYLTTGEEGIQQLNLLKSLLINAMIDDEFVVHSKERALS